MTGRDRSTIRKMSGQYDPKTIKEEVLTTYRVWHNSYYNCPVQVFPSKDQVLGDFTVGSECELIETIRKLTDNPKDYSWEIIDNY